MSTQIYTIKGQKRTNKESKSEMIERKEMHKHANNTGKKKKNR